MTMASPCYVPSGNYVKDYETLQKLRGINLEMKIAYTKTIIPREEGGLGMKSVLEFMGIPTGSNQSNLDDFEVSK